MKQEIEIKLKKITDLTITEQLILAFDTLIDLKDPTIIKAKMNQAIIGGTIADLFNLNKAGLVNNKVVLSDDKKTNLTYVNDLIDHLLTLDQKKLMIDIIFSYQHKAKEIKNNLQDELIRQGFLQEKRNFPPLIGPKEIHVSEQQLINNTKKRIVNSLDDDSKPEKEFIYVLAILDAVELLSYFLDTSIELDKKKERLKDLMEEEYIAKLIHDAIQNQPDPESLNMYEEPPLYTMGGTL